MEKKKGETAYVPKLFTPRNEARDIFRAAPRAATGGGFWRWGSDNLYPYALAQMFRRSTTHRRIVNDKADICRSADAGLHDMMEIGLSAVKRTCSFYIIYRKKHVLFIVIFFQSLILFFSSLFLRIDRFLIRNDIGIIK